MRASGSPSKTPRGPRSEDETPGDKSGAPADHLAAEFEQPSNRSHAPEKANEWACTTCHRRVTRGATGKEYGHERDCPHGLSGGDGA